ncbi:MAG: DNA polymerase III subunit delta, partial [Rhodospirillales bacterium]|nr:DNA polymerase III subunit delta [Rhodospirillales bacterium]
MKLSGSRIDSFVRTPDPKVRAILVYGPDGGLVRERIERLARGVVADLTDPFRVADLSAKSILDDPARLADEAASLSLTGGRRVVRIRDAGDSLTNLFTSFLDHSSGDSLVLAEAGELG